MSKENAAQQANQSKQPANKPIQTDMPLQETAVVNPIPALQRAYTEPRTLSPADAHIFQRTIGNQALGRLIIQRKMTLGPVGVKYEQEADAVAKQVVNNLAQQSTPQAASQPTTQRQEEKEAVQMKPLPAISSLQRQEEEELQMKPHIQRQEEELQMKQDPMLAGGELSGDIEGAVQSAKSGGQQLDDTIRQPMEQAFGADFSSVKVHNGSQADNLNRSLSARAFTSGQDVFFRQGEYNPGNSAGKELLAHELTHVVQQNGGAVQRKMPLPQHATTETTLVEDHSIQAKAESSEQLTALSKSESTEAISAKSQTTLNQSPQVVQRALPTYKGWKTASKIAGAKIDWRSSEMNAIGTTLKNYNKTAYPDNKAKMAGLLNILKAISAWQLKKDSDANEAIPTLKGNQMVPKTNDQNPQAHETRGRSVAVNTLLDEIKLEIHNLLATDQSDWDESNFSSPNLHDKTNFKYLVNGIQEYDDTPDYITAVLQDPTLIKNALMSISFITNDKTPLWCPSGFVVKVPKENIVAAKPEDAAAESSVSLYHSVEVYKEAARLFNVLGLPAPAELIKQTEVTAYASKHNEVVALGQGATGKTTEPVGIFIVENPLKPNTPIDIGYILTDDELGGRAPSIQVSKGKYKKVMKKQPGVSAERMKIYDQTAKDKNLPIIYIPMSVNANFSATRFSAWDESKFIDYDDPLVKKEWNL